MNAPTEEKTIDVKVSLCDRHQTGLRAALRARLLGPFMAATSSEAARRFEDALVNGATVENFEPFVGATQNIIKSVLKCAGARAIMNPDGGERCPLCYVIETCTCGRGDDCDYRKWTTKAADGMKAYAIGIGLLT